MQKMQQSLHILITASIVLSVLGLLFVYSASSVYALTPNASPYFYALRHLTGLLLGCLGACILRYLPIKFIYKYTPLAFGGAFLLTAMTLLPLFSVTIHGSSRWLHLFGFTFQPSELLKITFILFLAKTIAQKQRHIDSFIVGYLPFLVLIAGVGTLLLMQPDFGLAVTLGLTALSLLFIAGARWLHLAATIFAGIPAIVLLIFYKPYRLKRILTFLDPWADPQGAGFQIIQSLIAIGSGGLFGVGIGNSQQKFFYLPMQHTDFIFSIIAEEIGFVGVCIIIGLFLTFFYNGLKLGTYMKDPFSRYVTFGFVILTTLQALINSAVATGIAPTKGVGLPFMSYGNSALVCTIAMLGLLINMKHNSSSR